MASIVGWKNCPVCGGLFYVNSKDWAFKRQVMTGKNSSELMYFCKWSCLQKFNIPYEKRIEENRKRAGRKKTKKEES